MNWDSDDQKMKEFLKSHRPLAPSPRENEAETIWSKILYLHPKIGIPYRQVVFATILVVISISVLMRLRLDEALDPVIVVGLEQSLELELEGEDEMKEVDDLIALAYE